MEKNKLILEAWFNGICVLVLLRDRLIFEIQFVKTLIWLRLHYYVVKNSNDWSTVDFLHLVWLAYICFTQSIFFQFTKRNETWVPTVANKHLNYYNLYTFYHYCCETDSNNTRKKIKPTKRGNISGQTTDLWWSYEQSGWSNNKRLIDSCILTIYCFYKQCFNRVKVLTCRWGRRRKYSSLWAFFTLKYWRNFWFFVHFSCVFVWTR